ncbi:MAG: transglutaminase-like domain-containing protein [Caldilineaceae bacterium]|nr:transglutaminase-like domain-containing protein [Caldilineaceae bacterium]
MEQTERLDQRLAIGGADQSHWAMRALRWLGATFRPDGGWLVLLACVVLAALPAMALGENRLAELRRIQVGLDLVGPLAVLTVWAWLGWRRSRPAAQRRWWKGVLTLLAVMATGVLILTQTLVAWLPTVGDVWWAAWNNGWRLLAQQMVDAWGVLATRFALWWQGVQAGGAAQDNLIFAALAGAIFWLAAAMMAWLARRFRRGLPAASPVLWLLGALLLYSPGGRGLMLGGVLLALALHLLLDQESLMRRWQAHGLDFNPALFVDRVLTTVTVVAVIAVVAAILPNLYVERVVWGYYGMMQPMERQLESFRDRLFPNLRGASRLQGGGALDGLPNEFLLGGNISLGDNVVMIVRTSDSAGYQDYYGGAPFELPPPPGHYMRGATLTHYDGRGWSNPPATRTDGVANERWDRNEPVGRQLLVQSVSMRVNSSVLYGAPELIEPGVNYDVELRNDGDLVAIWSRAGNYTVVSAIPAVSEAQLAALPAWGDGHPLPDGYEMHLELPDTITDRTRQLAAELTADAEGPYAQAQAIERYLRQYEYDLTVSEPPRTVTDVADHFLFELQRGYCDYYTTAFVVLARLNGLPTRFATGYAVGHWDPMDGSWIVTEAEAHSWPEVYLPEYGWIAFEPTAGRAELVRTGLPEATTAAAPAPIPAPTATEEPTAEWNWQMLFWLLPVALLAWAAWVMLERWRRRREDPWVGLLRWGRRAGRPLAAGETVLEYGAGLASFIVERQTSEQDTGRVAAREVTGLSNAVSNLHYAPTSGRAAALARAAEHWQRLRDYLPRLRVR